MRIALMKDAFSHPRMTRPGCQHNLGCRCDVPFHLRPSTPAEEAKQNQYAGMFTERQATDERSNPDLIFPFPKPE